MTLKEWMNTKEDLDKMKIGAAEGSAFIFIGNKKEWTEMADRITKSHYNSVLMAMKRYKNVLDCYDKNREKISSKIISLETEIVFCDEESRDSVLEELANTRKRMRNLKKEYKNAKEKYPYFKDIVDNWKPINDLEIMEEYDSIETKNMKIVLVDSKIIGMFWTRREFKDTYNIF